MIYSFDHIPGQCRGKHTDGETDHERKKNFRE